MSEFAALGVGEPGKELLDDAIGILKAFVRREATYTNSVRREQRVTGLIVGDVVERAVDLQDPKHTGRDD